MSKIILEFEDANTAKWVVRNFLGNIEGVYAHNTLRLIEAEKLYDELHKQIKKQTTELKFDEIFENLGWTVVCESPFEIEHYEGSKASGLAAKIVYDELKENWEDYM